MVRPKKSDEPLVELYKCKNFVADSMTDLYASHSKITKDGDIVIKTIGKIQDRHLIAEPSLPSLEQRTSQSKNKKLYDLSLQLADESENSERSCNADSNVCKGCSKCRGAKYQFSDKENTKPGQRIPLPPEASPKKPLQGNKKAEQRKLSESRNSQKNKKLNPKPKPRDGQGDTCSQPVIKPKPNPQANQPKIPEINQKTQDKAHQAKVEPNLKVDPTESFSYLENPRSTFQKIEHNVASKQNKVKGGNSAKRNHKEVSKEVDIKKELKGLAMKNIWNILKVIDDCYLFTLFFVLGTLAYLVYVLFYDVSDYLNTEQRYLAKMKESDLLMRWFYYMMRRLRVPIF